MSEIEAPAQCPAGHYQLILRDALSETLSLTPSERCHSFNRRINGEWLLVGRPAWLKPAFRAEVLRVWILRPISKKCPVFLQYWKTCFTRPNISLPVKWKNPRSLRKIESMVYIICFHLVCDASWTSAEYTAPGIGTTYLLVR